MDLKPFFSIVLDLEIPRNRCIHPRRSKARERSNLEFPTYSTKSFRLFSVRKGLMWLRIVKGQEI